MYLTAYSLRIQKIGAVALSLLEMRGPFAIVGERFD